LSQREVIPGPLDKVEPDSIAHDGALFCADIIGDLRKIGSAKALGTPVRHNQDSDDERSNDRVYDAT
jgi:hypothetical protein